MKTIKNIAVGLLAVIIVWLLGFGVVSLCQAFPYTCGSIIGIVIASFCLHAIGTLFTGD
jgi:hypothetical protein